VHTVKVVGFGTYDRAKHPRIGILLDGLSQHGVDVAELNAPLGFSTAERVAMLAAPWLGYRFVFRLARRWLHLTLGRFRSVSVHRPDAVLVGYLGHFDVLLARILYPRTVIVLDLLIFAADTGADRGARPGLKLRLLATLDALAVRCADVVVLDTVEHLALLPPGGRGKGVVAPVGCPDEWFCAPPAERVPGPLRVVFYGLFTPLQGAPVIGRALDLLGRGGTPIEVTMIGTGQDLPETRRVAGRVGEDGPDTAIGLDGAVRVRWQDWIEPAELPALVATHDVCLGIFGTGPKALRVTPNKVFQGAAAGCAVLTSDTVPQRRSLGDTAVYVPAGDAAALAKALGSLAAEPDRVLGLRQQVHERAEAAFRPRRVSEPLLSAVTAAVDRKSRA
jgi:glycosyltransferase involved in cell wall biosynthesis